MGSSHSDHMYCSSVCMMGPEGARLRERGEPASVPQTHSLCACGRRGGGHKLLPVKYMNGVFETSPCNACPQCQCSWGNVSWTGFRQTTRKDRYLNPYPLVSTVCTYVWRLYLLERVVMCWNRATSNGCSSSSTLVTTTIGNLANRAWQRESLAKGENDNQ